MKRVQLILVLDSSTDNSATDQVGPSTCFWAAYLYTPADDTHPTNLKLAEQSRYESAVLMKALDLPPVRCGAIYNDADTPTKIFYDGVLRALEACFYLVKKHSVTEVIITGDCEPVLDSTNRHHHRSETGHQSPLQPGHASHERLHKCRCLVSL